MLGQHVLGEIVERSKILTNPRSIAPATVMFAEKWRIIYRANVVGLNLVVISDVLSKMVLPLKPVISSISK